MELKPKPIRQEDLPPLELTRTEHEISSGRKLYNYKPAQETGQTELKQNLEKRTND